VNSDELFAFSYSLFFTLHSSLFTLHSSNVHNLTQYNVHYYNTAFEVRVNGHVKRNIAPSPLPKLKAQSSKLTFTLSTLRRRSTSQMTCIYNCDFRVLKLPCTLQYSVIPNKDTIPRCSQSFIRVAIPSYPHLTLYGICAV